MPKIQVVRFKQMGFTLYSGVMSVRQLLTHGITTEWDPGIGWQLEGQGYQRAPLEEHWRKIGNFLRTEGNPLLPTSALLASRDDTYGRLQFTSVDGDMGYLEIPDERSLFIIDYQHRWRGFRYAIENLRQVKLQDVRIPVTILSDTPLVEEVKQFYLINNKQKRVDTDLALTLMQAMSSEATEEELANLVGAGYRYRIRGTRLVVRIAQLNTGPWANKIQEPNTPAASSQIASLKSFVDSLRPIVSVRSPVYRSSDDELLAMLDSVWKGVLALWPEWTDKFEQYAIQRAIGLFVVHRVARQLLIPRMLASGDYSPSSVTNTLSQATQWLDRDFWRTRGRVGAYSSGAGQKELAESILHECQR